MSHKILFAQLMISEYNIKNIMTVQYNNFNKGYIINFILWYVDIQSVTIHDIIN